MDSSDEIIIQVEQYFNTEISNVWKAITQVEKMREWFFSNIPEFPEVGFVTEFTVDANGKDFIHQWKILEVKKLEKIVYDWRYENYDGAGTVIFNLIDVEGRCLLQVKNLGLETFPKDVPEFRPESCRAGWKYFINDRLLDYLI